jgi:hypothetical protein
MPTHYCSLKASYRANKLGSTSDPPTTIITLVKKIQIFIMKLLYFSIIENFNFFFFFCEIHHIVDVHTKNNEMCNNAIMSP